MTQTATPPRFTVGPQRRGAGHVRRRGRWDVKYSPYAFVAPFFVLFAAFGLFPLIYTAYISLYRVELTDPGQRVWAGLGNYAGLLHDPFFWNALRNTFTIGAISTIPQLLMALGLAHLLNYRLRGRTFFRVAMMMPYATSVAAATLVFAQLFGRDYGLINWALGLVGVHRIDWQNGTWASQVGISTIVTWRWTGYNALIYLAGMQSIPAELYESAAIDGASRWQQFRHVTIRGLRPTIIFTVIVSTIGATQLFGEPLLYEGGTRGPSGGVSHQYQTLGLYLYDQGWSFFHLGRAAAVAWVMFLIIVVLVTLNTGIARLRSCDERALGRKGRALR
ncbi:sugar ABC transporter permease [Streptomyces sp. RB6PN25]|uniref:Sugar ABC transporter permease n=1 Tax=Streptomyces humicola TaxID=2953240 RepID=A0ABT1Q7N3_9ACTN|nr:sugar ABC transporter permease [Streptomyces humicola]MCQ4084787.1 sugar ABC transporter permease [Streptomyces humicola]